MRKTPRTQPASRGIDSSELPRVAGGATLSVGNLLLSIGGSASSNIDTALQLGPR
ncbi:MAG: hypothetical protein ABI163_15760 [Thermoanaerobaculia bacterium]